VTNNVAQHRESLTWNEIQSQGAVWRALIGELGQSADVDKMLASSRRAESWLFVGCGTSFYLAEAAATSWSILSGQETRALPASEVLLYPALSGGQNRDVQAVVISRSGHTSEAVRAASALKRELHFPTFGLTCAEQSALEAECDCTLVLPATDDKSTVMTRSFTSMLISLQYLAARSSGNAEFIQSLQEMANRAEPLIRLLSSQVESFVASRAFADYVFLGQGPFYGVAREAALKVMEMSCSYSQAFHSLEFRHGPKAIVSPQTCLTFYLSETGQQAETEVLQEMKELGGVTIAVCSVASKKVRDTSDLVIEANVSGNEVALLAPYSLPAQLMGFFTGIGKGLNPDHPKNLTRVVVLD
jgi:glucosamine--fructose-6-phosphate aminotransferase (isomerizing)